MSLLIQTALAVLLAFNAIHSCISSPITRQSSRGAQYRSSTDSSASRSSVLGYINDNFREEVLKIKEDKAIDIINSIQTQDITLAKDIYTSNGKIQTSFVKFEKKMIGSGGGGGGGDIANLKSTTPFEWLSNSAKGLTRVSSKKLPLVLLHGFDSSCLEFRRIAPLLNEDRDVYIPDILGWGFNDHSTVIDFSPQAKLAHLESFIKEVVKGPCVLVGASLGGGIAINFAADAKTAPLVDRVVLLDAQGFIDGEGPRDIADNVALLGVGILKSVPLRMLANVFSYRDKLQFSTWDALLCGRLHCYSPFWERASVDFLRSGGFVVSPNVERIAQKTLIVFGKNDDILDKTFPTRFQEQVPDNKLVLVDECGHVPHLEKPLECAKAIMDFLA